MLEGKKFDPKEKARAKEEEAKKKKQLETKDGGKGGWGSFWLYFVKVQRATGTNRHKCHIVLSRRCSSIKTDLLSLVN